METLRHISFSSFIKHTTDENIIQEGLFSNLFSNKKSGGFLSIFSFITNGVGEKKSELDKTIEDLAAKAESDANARLKDLEKSAEAAAVAKLKAKYEANKNQLKLANDKRINAYNELKAKYERQAKAWVSNTFAFSESEMNAKMEKMDAELEALENTSSYDEAKQMADLTRMVLIKPDGSTRTLDEIKNIQNMSAEDLKNNPELQEVKDSLDTISKIKTDNSSKLVEALKSEDGQMAFKEITEEVVGKYPTEQEVKKMEEDFQRDKENWERSVEAVKKVKEAQEAHETAQEEYNTAQSDLDKLKKPSIYDVKEPAEMKTKFAEEFKGEDFAGAFKGDEENKQLDEGKLSKMLKDKGVPANVASKIVKNIKKINQDGGLSVDGLPDLVKGEIEKLDDSEIKSIRDEVKQAYDKKHDELNVAFNTASDKLATHPDPYDKDNEHPDETIRKAVQEMKNMTDEQKKSLTEGNAYYEQRKKEFEERGKKVEEERNRQKSQIRSNKLKREEAQRRADAHSIPNEIADQAKKISDERNAGEVEKDGKVGYYDDKGKFQERKANMTSKERDEYLAGIKRAQQLGPIGEGFGKIQKIKKTADGKYLVDGEELKGDIAAQEKEVAQIMANNESIVLARNGAVKAKRELADNIKKLIKSDGTVDEDKWKELTPQQRQLYTDALTDTDTVFNTGDDDDPIDLGPLKDAKTVDAIMTWMDENKEVDDPSDEEVEDDELKDADDDVEGDEDEKYTDEEGNTTTRKKKIVNPAKIWKRRRKKNGDGMTQSFYNKDGDSISEKEYNKMKAAFQDALAKKKRSQPTSESNTLSIHIPFAKFIMETINRK